MRSERSTTRPTTPVAYWQLLAAATARSTPLAAAGLATTRSRSSSGTASIGRRSAEDTLSAPSPCMHICSAATAFLACDAGLAAISSGCRWRTMSARRRSRPPQLSRVNDANDSRVCGTLQSESHLADGLGQRKATLAASELCASAPLPGPSALASGTASSRLICRMLGFSICSALMSMSLAVWFSRSMIASETPCRCASVSRAL
mmetsp:Transcript_25812/g.80821  ORF Transcript_25812/g.80821 Transcript_25812/m.80821 type:complete len:205 (+) Transcript_25812:151-765(+)